MEYRLSDILDISAIQSLMESFYALTGVPFGLLDLDGNILAGIGWQQLCTEFHRANPTSGARCLRSNRQIAERVKRAAPGETIMYKCENGLMESVLPIIIQGTHCGNFILGQFLFEPPDDSFFRTQAQNFNFDEKKYMEALREVPVFSREQVKATMEFYSKLVDMMAESGLKNLRLLNAQQEIRDKEAWLAQTHKMEAIGTLAGGIAHDFNNILSAILGFVHLSLNDKSVNRQVRARLQKTAQAAERASELVQQILNFSRTEANVREPVSIRSIIIETLRLLRASLPVTITLEKKLSTDGLVMGDQSRLHQMLMNLCTNAGQAIPGGTGTITVELEKTQAQMAVCGFSGPAVLLRVADTGLGMPPEVVKQIFTPFFTTRSAGQGTGLGLSLVHSIVADHGGSIRVSSTPGQGTIFSVYLPAHVPESEPVRQQPTAVPELPGGTEHILVVDDEPMIAEIITDGLEQLGYRVTTHSDPQEAMLTFGRNPGKFDLIISDLTMPTMSGVDLFRAARCLRRDIPFILCTGYALDNAMPDLDITRFSAVIPKPVSSRALATAVRNCLD